MKIILASASPRRQELLKKVCKNFDVIVSGAEEIVDDNLEPERKAEEITYLKAKTVYDMTKGDRVVIGSDTIVAKDGRVYGKPKDRQDAIRMIHELLGGDRTHEVISGVSVIIEKNNQVKEYKTYAKAKVYFKDISEEEIEKWIDTGKAMDKAGAYAIQEEFCVHIEKIDGDYFSIVGLPLNKIYDILKKEEILYD